MHFKNFVFPRLSSIDTKYHIWKLGVVFTDNVSMLAYKIILCFTLNVIVCFPPSAFILNKHTRIILHYRAILKSFLWLVLYQIALIYVRIVFLIPNGSMHLFTINTMSAFWNLMVHSFNFVEINLATKAIFSKIKHRL